MYYLTVVCICAQYSLGLERLLFDFTASMIERAIRLHDARISFEDLVPTLRELMRRYPYERQKRYVHYLERYYVEPSDHSSYQVFCIQSAPIEL